MVRLAEPLHAGEETLSTGPDLDPGFIALHLSPSARVTQSTNMLHFFECQSEDQAEVKRILWLAGH